MTRRDLIHLIRQRLRSAVLGGDAPGASYPGGSTPTGDDSDLGGSGPPVRARQPTRHVGHAVVVFGVAPPPQRPWLSFHEEPPPPPEPLWTASGTAANEGLALYRQRLREDITVVHGVDLAELDRVIEAHGGKTS